MVGGEQWGEIVNGPLGEGSWASARWRRAVTGQFAAALERGELWTEDGTQVAGHVPIAVMADVCNVGPQHRKIRGSLGVFDGYHGWDGDTQFSALWSLDSSVHNRMTAEPNARLVPQPQRSHAPIWSQAGTLQMAPSVRYTSQPIMAVRTSVTTLGVNTWITLCVHEDDPVSASNREATLALWCNSTLGVLTQANHANSIQEGRGIGNRGMLLTLMTLDVRKLETWQIDEAKAIWQDFSERKFQPFYQCAVDPARIELDERVVRDMLGLGESAVTAVAKLRMLLASDPSVHGSKKPELPS